MLDWLAHRAQVSPHKIALIFGDQRWTYGELNGVVAQLCGQLTAVGVQAGQQVAVLMPNRPEYVYLTRPGRFAQHGTAQNSALFVMNGVQVERYCGG